MPNKNSTVLHSRWRGHWFHAASSIVGTYALTMFGAIVIAFLLPRALPGDPLAVLLEGDSAVVISEEARDEMASHYGLDKPLTAQFGTFITGLFTGDLGWSSSQRMPVTEALKNRLPWTLGLVVPAMLISTTLGFVAGVEAAWARNRLLDRVSVFVFSILRSIPDYVVAIALLIGLAVILPFFPLSGSRTAFSETDPLLVRAVDVAYHAVLPVGALTASLLGMKFLLARSSMVAVLGQEYLLLARAKGLTPLRIRYSHGARNAVAPVLAQLGLQFGFAIGGAVFIEQIFAYPGLGSLTLNAVDARDYPLLDACFLLLAFAVIGANLVVDLVTSIVVPQELGR